MLGDMIQSLDKEIGQGGRERHLIAFRCKRL